jgi:hypothetical protein
MKHSTASVSELEVVMAKVSVTIKVVRRWWVTDVLSLAICYCWLTGRDEMPEAFIDWLVTRGFKFEVE